MQHLDEGTIHAWIDGELPSPAREEAEAHVATCEQCAAAVAEARGFIAASSRILTALDAVPGGVLPAASQGLSTSKGAARPRFLAPRAWMAAAAVLVLGTVTVIAIRPRGDEARLRVASAPLEEKVTAMNSTVAPHVMDSVETGAATRVAPAPAPAPTPSTAASAAGASANVSSPQPSANARIAESSTVDQTDKLKKRLDAERQSTRRKESGPPMMADAAPAASADDRASALASRKPAEASRASDALVAKSAPARQPAAPVVAQASPPASARLSDSSRATGLGLDSVVVTGQGTISSTKKPEAVVVHSEAGEPGQRVEGIAIRGLVGRVPYRVLPDGEHADVVSVSSSAESGEPVEITTYRVRNEYITFIDRLRPDTTRRTLEEELSSPLERRQDASAGKINSITWTDSAGRIRTLRGQVPTQELERLKRGLFGPTP